MTISTWLQHATKQLEAAGITSARLDAELLLAETIRTSRTYLHAWPDAELEPRRVDIANARLDLRLERVPMAYILGYKEFFGRNFSVTPSVLVPRPESEDIIHLFLEVTADDVAPHSALIDIGTGSGCLGITAKLERPNIHVILSDVSPQALQVAAKNAAALHANVAIQEQDLLSGQIEPINFIIANLPYVDESWDVSPELRHEPRLALFAPDSGLKLMLRLIEQAAAKLPKNGWLFLEADPIQHHALIHRAEQHEFTHHKTQHYALALRRK